MIVRKMTKQLILQKYGQKIFGSMVPSCRLRGNEAALEQTQFIQAQPVPTSCMVLLYGKVSHAKIINRTKL